MKHMMPPRCFLFYFLTIQPNYGFFVPRFDDCKLTRSGHEYAGKVSQTSSSIPCQHWVSSTPHSGTDRYQDSDFTDGSKKAAKNYCRNPRKGGVGPWCFTSKTNVEMGTCSIPICSFKTCLWTGPGHEFDGNKRLTLLENECAPWSIDSKEFWDLDALNDAFPEGNRLLAARGCRNPTDDQAGPYCMVPIDKEDPVDNTTSFGKEYCEIPFCFPTEGLWVLSNSNEPLFNHFSTIVEHPDGGQVDLSFKLWSPETWDKAELRIGLSALAVPSSGDEIRSWGIGYQVVLRTGNSTITPNKEEDTTDLLVNIPGLLNGLEWVNLSIKWGPSHVAVTYTNKSKPLILLETKDEIDSIVAMLNYELEYISFSANAMIFLLTDYTSFNGGEGESCEIHVTTSLKLQRFMLLRRLSVGGQRELQAHVRPHSVAAMFFVSSPGLVYPRLVVEMAPNSLTVVLIESQDKKTLLDRVEMLDLVSYWKWTQFEAFIVGSRFQMFMKRGPAIHGIADMTNEVFQTFRWFAVGSSSKAHWSFFCIPKHTKDMDPTPPECSYSDSAVDYIGTLDVSQSGSTCLPWAGDYVGDKTMFNLIDGSVAAGLNYCRNPSADVQGSYCYVRSGLTFTREYCSIRKCSYSHCRIAGTGDDFSSSLTTTRTNQTCQAWTSDQPHKKTQEANNPYNFPERDVTNASNYCRDPTKDIGGPWCYTTNPLMKWDRCKVPDCYEPEECTLLVTGAPLKKSYINPQWKVDGIKFKLKIWNPANFSEASISFLPLKGVQNLTFIIGSGNNEFLTLYYFDEMGKRAILKQKVMPHLLSSGKWTAIELDVRTGEFVARFQGIPDPFFTWEFSRVAVYYKTIKPTGNPDEVVAVKPFPPAYYSYGGDPAENAYVGWVFPCSECQIEISDGFSPKTVFFPVNMWLMGTTTPAEEIRFNLRGPGSAQITFYALPSSGVPELIVNLNAGNKKSYYEVETRRKKGLLRLGSHVTNGTVFSEKMWTPFYIGLNHKKGFLKRNEEVFYSWDNVEYILPYFFTFEASYGEVIWTVNCDPPDIDGLPVNGGWSEWAPWFCSATCGGGRGWRKRTCTSPKPSAFGEPCLGQATETGVCNSFKCGTVSPYTLGEITRNLKSAAFNKKVNLGGSFQLNCNHSILDILKKESPTSTIYWARNGVKLSSPLKLANLDRPDSFYLAVSDVEVNDTGVYGCFLQTNDGMFVAVDIYAVIVVSDKVVWFHGDIPARIYDIDARDVSFEKIEIHYSVAGVWSCSIIDDELNLSWTTNWARLLVKARFSLASHLMEDKLTRPIFGYFKNETQVRIFLAFIYLLAVGAAGFFVWAKIRQRKAKRMFEKRFLGEHGEKEMLINPPTETSSESETEEFSKNRKKLKKRISQHWGLSEKKEDLYEGKNLRNSAKELSSDDQAKSKKNQIHFS